MMEVPPVEWPSLQVNAAIESLVTSVLSVKSTGESGTNKIVAPLPIGEGSDSPYKFDAVTVANTLSPRTRS
jgi:hypothetical protein